MCSLYVFVVSVLYIFDVYVVVYVAATLYNSVCDDDGLNNAIFINVDATMQSNLVDTAIKLL